MIFRKGELGKVRYRTDRCFRVGEDWWKDIGTFKGHIAAERTVLRYVLAMTESKKSGIYVAVLQWRVFGL